MSSSPEIEKTSHTRAQWLNNPSTSLAWVHSSPPLSTSTSDLTASSPLMSTPMNAVAERSERCASEKNARRTQINIRDNVIENDKEVR